MAGDAATFKAVDIPNPYELKMLTIGTDQISVNYHGIALTHLDSLAHINDDWVFYTGYKPNTATVLSQGHDKDSTEVHFPGPGQTSVLLRNAHPISFRESSNR